jgi:hypothetical protein
VLKNVEWNENILQKRRSILRHKHSIGGLCHPFFARSEVLGFCLGAGRQHNRGTCDQICSPLFQTNEIINFPKFPQQGYAGLAETIIHKFQQWVSTIAIGVALGSGFGVVIGAAIGAGLGVQKKGKGKSKSN